MFYIFKKNEYMKYKFFFKKKAVRMSTSSESARLVGEAPDPATSSDVVLGCLFRVLVCCFIVICVGGWVG